MAGLKQIVENCNSEEFDDLRHQTIHCMCVIGKSVGGAIFLKDANDMMNAILNKGEEEVGRQQRFFLYQL